MYVCICNAITVKDLERDPELKKLLGTKCGRCMNFNHIPVEIDELKRVNTSEGRRYTTPSGLLYPSITTILSYKSKPGIDAWRKRVGEEEANKVTRIATTRGTAIHKLCENALRNEPEDLSNLSLLDQEMYSDFRPLLNEIDNIKAIEATMYSDHLRLAGQVDCIAEYRGRLSVIDFKTSKKKKEKWMCENMFIQCSAYAIMFEERTGIPIDQIVILMAQEDEGPVVFVEKRDNYVPKLMEARNEFEKKTGAYTRNINHMNGPDWPGSRIEITRRVKPIEELDEHLGKDLYQIDSDVSPKNLYIELKAGRKEAPEQVLGSKGGLHLANTREGGEDDHFVFFNDPADLSKRLVTGEWAEHDITVFNPFEYEIFQSLEYDKIIAKTYRELNSGACQTRYANLKPGHEVIQWSLFWLFHTFNISQRANTMRMPDQNPTVLFCSMNGNVRNHRDELWRVLVHKNLLNKYCSYLTRGVTIDIAPETEHNSLSMNVDETVKSHTFPPFYKDILIDVVCETMTKGLFYTEKTWKPILGERIPILISAPGAHQQLKDWGFELYDEIIDYRFDNMADMNLRVEAVTNQLKALAETEDPKQLYLKTKEKRAYNREHAFKLVKQQKDIPDLAFKDITCSNMLTELISSFQEKA